MRDQCERYLLGVAKVTAVYDAALNCLALAYKQNKNNKNENNYYILETRSVSCISSEYYYT